MPAVTLAALGELDYARRLGKTSTESDVQLLTFKEGDVHVSMVAPHRHPEKVQPLCYAVNSADAILLVVDKVDRALGETLVAAAAAGHAKGLIVLRNYVQPEQVQPLLRGTSLEAIPITTEDKEALVRQEIARLATPLKDGPARVPIDHHFHVKGIGAVILGFVGQGTVKKHDALRLYPTDKTAQVRSIQVHDVDVAEAHTGDHVGLALKAIDNDAIDRGFVLAPDGTLDVAPAGGTVTLDCRLSPFFKPGITKDTVYHLAVGWQFANARAKDDLTAGGTGKVAFELGKPLVHEPGQRVLLVNLDNPGLRIAGHGTC